MTATASTPILSAKPVVLDAPERGGTPLEVRVTAPRDGDGPLPLLLFSHGFGWSLDGYAPLADHWAAQGFVVIQPTFLDSRRLAIPAEDPRTPTIWRQRVLDVKHALDQLDTIEAALPGLAGRVDRVDRERIAAAGHSFGAQTTSVLLGARVLDADGTPGEDLSDARVKAGVLLAPAGAGGADLSPFAAEHFPFMNPHFDTLATPALVVAGDERRLAADGPRARVDDRPVPPQPRRRHAADAVRRRALARRHRRLGGRRDDRREPRARRADPAVDDRLAAPRARSRQRRVGGRERRACERPRPARHARDEAGERLRGGLTGAALSRSSAAPRARRRRRSPRARAAPAAAARPSRHG